MEKYHKPIQHFWLWWKHMILYNIYIYYILQDVFHKFSEVSPAWSAVKKYHLTLEYAVCGRKSLGFPSPVFVRIVSHLLIIYFLYFLH
jgi:hypothetical protein